MENVDSEPVLATQPPSPEGRKLVEAFAEESVKQAARYDDLAKEMIKLLLGVPGLYLAALKLGADQKLVLHTTGVVFNALAFAGWGAAAVAAFRGLFPRRYNVMPGVPFRVGDRPDGDPLTIEEFYAQAARFKAVCLAWSAVLFFLGILLAALSLFFYGPKASP